MVYNTTDPSCPAVSRAEKSQFLFENQTHTFPLSKVSREDRYRPSPIVPLVAYPLHIAAGKQFETEETKVFQIGKQGTIPDERR
jgi:hypothetical protein